MSECTCEHDLSPCRGIRNIHDADDEGTCQACLALDLATPCVNDPRWTE